MKSCLIEIIFVFVVLHLDEGVDSAAGRTTADRILSHGYYSESHSVTTSDGFTLQLFRIKKSRRSDNGPQRPAVLLMHGFTGSSDCWVFMGPEIALSYELVERGYDVWLGNSRGNPYGMRHSSMSPKEKKYWRFSWHEIGTIDLPTMMDYILRETGHSALHYVGHSQGTTIMFVLLSSRPEYNHKLKTAHMLAPIAYMKNVRSELLLDMVPLLGTYGPLTAALGDEPFMQQKFLQQMLGFEKCRNPDADMKMCTYILFSIYGGASGYFNESIIPEFFATHPASCSTHQAIHFVQLHVSGHFRQYDFGPKGNQKRYNRSTPPDYEVSNIQPRFPLHFYYSNFDELSSKKDVEKLSELLGNNSINHFIDLKRFVHLDFLAATNVKEVINRGVIERMDEVELALKGRFEPI
uniref:Lipase n=1 Tax=Musca domestica TaxID=7370 RepID=A0A1I8NHT4_MUSDO